jgi:hypothetical protein
MSVPCDARERNCVTFLAWLAAVLLLCGGGLARADVTAAQRRAAEELLGAAAGGGAPALAPAIHPDELDLLRRRLLDQMKLEEERRESTVRARLFGAAMPLAELERLTPSGFYSLLARRLSFPMREFDDVRWLDAVDDSGGMVQVVGRGRQPEGHGNTRVPVMVSLVPWGKDWKAALPLELQAQIDDLIAGRGGLPGPRVAGPATAGTATPPSATAVNPAAILTLLDAAEASLRAGDCERYYEDHMSPGFRRATSSRALKTLIAACTNRSETRETLLAALRAVRTTAPRFEYQGTRAVYDLQGQGLPFPRFVLELTDKRWHVAE